MALFPLGILSAAGAGGAAVIPTYELIQTQILANNSSSQVQFTSGGVFASYSHLQLRIVARQYWVSGAPDATNLRITLNNTGTTYRTHFLRGAGSSVASGEQSGNANFNRTPVSTSTSSTDFGSMVIDILDINSTTKNKTMRSLGGMAFSYGNWIELASAARFETNAITSLEVIANSGTLGSGTRVSLYGIRG
jgi:hypothetical protein